MTSRPEALVALNPMARQGRAQGSWALVRPEVERRLAIEEVDLSASANPGEAPRGGGAREAIARALSRGVRTFVAAGGDGTVNALLNALEGARGEIPLESLVLGAVGLGSSNDFHKPSPTRLHGIPVRLDVGRAAPRDVVRVRFAPVSGLPETRLFLVSASLGVTARANAIFNGSGPVLRFVKGRSVGLAILYAALRGIATSKRIRASLRVGDGARSLAFSSLSVLKTPFLSGSLRFDTPVEPASGLFALNVCEEMGRLDLLRTLGGLLRGRFAGRPGTWHASASSAALELGEAEELELDGEVVLARRVTFDVLPAGIRVCG